MSDGLHVPVSCSFPVQGGVVTTGFWDLRPYSKPWGERTYIHRAWDIAHRYEDRAEIIAPEDGQVFYHYIERRPLENTHQHSWKDGTWYLLSNFYYDTFGGVVVLVGRDTGYTYVFGHMDADSVFLMLKELGISYKWVQHRISYNNYVRWVITKENMKGVAEGTKIGYIGNSGYSTGAHTHMQIHANRNYNSRIDPASLWPDVRIGDNGAGPDYGPREGADFIPSTDMSLEYLRGT